MREGACFFMAYFAHLVSVNTHEHFSVEQDTSTGLAVVSM